MMKRTSGQTGSELMLVLSVATLAITAAAFEFVPNFRAGVGVLAADVSSMLSHNAIGEDGSHGTNSGASEGAQDGTNLGSAPTAGSATAPAPAHPASR